MTFTPCFFRIFTGAPYLTRLSAQPRLGHALAAITAAVLGVMANLSPWFTAHVFFASVRTKEAGPPHLIRPLPKNLRLFASFFALVATYRRLWRHWPFPATLVLTALTSAGFALI